MSKIPLNFAPPSLYHLSEVIICKNIWIQSEIKEILKRKLNNVPQNDYIDGYFEIDNLLNLRDSNNEILNLVFNYIDHLPLPINIKNALKPLAEIMAIMVWEWLERMNVPHNHLLGNLTDYIDYMKWHEEGYIDSVATLRSMYYTKLFPDSNETWSKLSNYCLQDCLADFYGRVEFLDDRDFAFNLMRDLPYTHDDLKQENILPSYWLSIMQNRLDRFVRNLDAFLTGFSFYDTSEDLSITLFMVAINDENFPAAQYFWTPLTEDQKLRVITHLREGSHFYDILEGCRASTGIDLAVYLWKQFSACGDYKFFIEMLGHSQIMNRMIDWPWKDLFMRTLKLASPSIVFSDLEEMLSNICDTMSCFSSRSDNLIEFERIFNEIWYRFDDASRAALNLSPIVYDLAQQHGCLDKMINDPMLVEKRERFIDLVMVAYRSAQTDPADIENFCSIVLKNDEERLNFRAKLNDVNY